MGCSADVTLVSCWYSGVFLWCSGVLRCSVTVPGCSAVAPVFRVPLFRVKLCLLKEDDITGAKSMKEPSECSVEQVKR